MHLRVALLGDGPTLLRSVGLCVLPSAHRGLPLLLPMLGIMDLGAPNMFSNLRMQ